MSHNRSVPSASVVPVLVYPDVRAAVAFLETAFGFEERVQIGDDHRSQLRFGDGALIVGDVHGERRPPREGEETHHVVVRVEDVNAHCERARAAGARITAEPQDQFYGARTYRAMDPEGHIWNFSQEVRVVSGEEMEKATGLKIHTSLEDV